MGAWAVSRMRELVAGQGAEATATRRLYHLDAAAGDSVVVVSDERVCERAAREYYRHRLGPLPAGGVTVLRIGNRFAVEGAIRAGEWTILTIFSAQFEPIAHLAQ